MRGIAVLAGATAVWTVVTGIVPFTSRRIRMRVDGRTVAVSAGVGILAAFVMEVFLGIPAVSLAVGGLAGAVPVVKVQARRLAEAAAIRQRWPDILFRIRGSLSSGATLADATIEAFGGADAPFSHVAEDLRREILVGGGFGAGLASARTVFADATSDRVLMTLETASSTGGQRIGDILSTLAMSVGDEVRLFAAHDAAMTEQRLTINVALAAPWVLLVLAVATNPQAQVAFSTAEGTLIVVGGFVTTSVGWFLAMRTARLGEAPRVFR